MTERAPEELQEMRRRMEAAKDKPVDIQHFFYALQLQPGSEADRLWKAADRRLKEFESLSAPQGDDQPLRVRHFSRRAYTYRRSGAAVRRRRRKRSV
jgi:hypothetical protein